MRVLVGAPGSARTRVLAGVFRIKRLPLLPPPPLRRLAARRRGSTAVVTFDAPRGLDDFAVFATADGSFESSVRAIRVRRGRYVAVVPVRPTTRRIRVVGSNDDPGAASINRTVRLPPRRP